MNEKEVLLKAAYAAIREMDYVAQAKAFTFGSAQQLVFSAIIRSGSVEITEQDRQAFIASQSAQDSKE